ncbi:hypothetical protein LWI28_016290 [Acer negundo]|uniref:Uncharacterized protein n=1 Tax=Acer negundo TaxID=4023 RepID=A0AAD5IZG0_ACENE|nr:hypothetical protein LWI28_016290 [Acer negundo]
MAVPIMTQAKQILRQSKLLASQATATAKTTTSANVPKGHIAVYTLNLVVFHNKVKTRFRVGHRRAVCQNEVLIIPVNHLVLWKCWRVG